VTLRFVDTPLDAAVALPAPRQGSWPVALESACLAGHGVEPALSRLRAPGALAVTTGQQPGLFTGPLHTVYKALSARALARELEGRWGRPVVPVFWVAGDDHDFAEASTAHWLRPDGSLESGSLPPRSPEAPLTPMYREPLPEAVGDLLDRLEAALAPSEARDQTLAWLRRHYQPGRSVAGAFASALAELLAPFGIVCLDATHPAMKQAVAPLLLQALDRAGELEQALLARQEQLQRQGRAPDMALGDGATLVFLDGRLGRDRLILNQTGFHARRSRETFTLMQLEEIAGREPARLSPNVLLRPVVESALLPSVAYLAGPAELAYLELAAALYQRLEIPRQLPVPRWSGLVVEPRVSRALEKFGATLDQLLDPASDLEAQVARAGFPAGLPEAVERLRSEIEAGYTRIAESARVSDPTLETPVAGAKAAALTGLRDLEKRLIQHQKRREAESVGQITRARTALLPGGTPQERVLATPALLGRYGFGLLDDLARHVDGWYAAALEAVAAST